MKVYNTSATTIFPFILLLGLLPRSDAFTSSFNHITVTTATTNGRVPSSSRLQAMTRRDVTLLIGTSVVSSVVTHPRQSHAESPPNTPAQEPPLLNQQQIAKVETWPSIENLEPMYELKLSIDAMTAGVRADPKNWPYVKKRLDKFFKGTILSEKNFYFGVGLQYMNDIKYASSELPNYVVLDKQARYEALERTMVNLEGLKNVLGKTETTTDDAASVVEGYANDSQAALRSWFAMIPEKEIKAVEELFVHVKKADMNRDGVLSDDELASLSIREQQLWKKRVDKFG